ncbi:MAG: hypothetical protein LWW82_02925 [Comamonadaceae bacterium]|nr:hypothetical protein [Comamonadaceae bacterium]
MPSRYNAPALHFGVGRGRFWGLLAAALLGLAALGLMAWAGQGAARGAVPLLAAAGLWLLCAGEALRRLRQLGRLSGGVLRWDGVQWHWAPPAGGGPEQAVQLRLRRDLQWGLLLQLQGPGRRPCWLWLERAMQPADWLALRRAVYSRPRLGGGAGRSAPAADSF